MLEAIDVDFDYLDKPLINHVNFKVNAGEALHLCGANGKGKTTLLKLLAGLLRPISGEIRFQGQSIVANLAMYQQNICYVGHKNGMSQLLTVAENCRFELQRDSRDFDLESLLLRFDLEGLGDVKYGALSMGQRRRVGLLRLFMSNKSVWLLDEPFVALDMHAVLLLGECLAKHLQQGGMVVLTSHQPLPSNLGSHQVYEISVNDK